MNIYSKHVPTIKQLQYFMAVCEQHSFRKAADYLGVSQPPLSVQIRDLETKLEVTLLIRNTHQVVLTPAGQVFKAKAAALLRELCTLTHTIKAASEAAKLRVGCTKTLSFDFIAAINAFLTEFSAHIELYQHQYTSKELLFELQKGNIDFALVADEQCAHLAEQALLIHREPVLLALPSSHHCSTQPQVDLNDMADLALFWFKAHDNPLFYQQGQRLFNSLSTTLKRQPELDDNLNMLLAVAQGKSMLLQPQSMAQAHIAGVVYKPLLSSQAKQVLIDVYLVWRQNLVPTATTEAIINYFKAA